MMAIIAFLTGLFKFTDEIKSLILILRGTPEQNHEVLMKKIQDQADTFKKTGIPQ